MSKRRAFIVQETDELTGGIVYAEHAVVARREGAHAYADGEFSHVMCRRFPPADAIENDSRAQTWALLNEGWWFDNGRISLEQTPSVWVDLAGTAWATPYEWLSSRERIAKQKGRARKLVDKLWARFWFADRITLSLGRVEVWLPYMYGPLSFRIDNETPWVQARDLCRYRALTEINQDARILPSGSGR